MTDAVQIFKPGFRVEDANGDPVSGAVIYVFDAGTTTPRTVYSDKGLSTSLGTSVTCNSAGVPTSDGNAVVEIYTGTTAYKVQIKDSDGVLIPGFSWDNIIGALDTTPFAAATFAKPDTDVSADSTNTTLTTSDLGTVRNGNCSGGTITYTLPSAVTATNGKGYTFRHVGTANSISIATVSAQTIDGATSITLNSQYQTVSIVSDGANWHTVSRANGRSTVTPEGYLTLTSGTPIITGDVTAATSVYYTPFTGNIIPIYDGTAFVSYEFAELTLTLASQHTLSSHFDVFVFLNSGTVTIGTGPAWSTITAGAGARGTGAGTTQLSRVKGLLTNTVAITARNGSTTYSVGAGLATYVGSLYIDGTAGQITCHRTWGASRKWGVWNAYNRQPILLEAGDSTSNWNYPTNTIRASNGASTNSLTVFCGLAEEQIHTVFNQRVSTTTTTAVAEIGVGWNSTTAYSGRSGPFQQSVASTSIILGAVAEYLAPPSLGINTVTCLERGVSGTPTFNGTETNMILLTRWRG